jgi:co-chaperonin GroES (HSP10)
MNAVRIKQTVTHEGIIIPLNKVRKFKGKQVEIIIISDSDTETSETAETKSLKKNLSIIFEKYNDVKPFKNIDPPDWEKEIRNEWQNSAG